MSNKEMSVVSKLHSLLIACGTVACLAPALVG